MVKFFWKKNIETEEEKIKSRLKEIAEERERVKEEIRKEEEMRKIKVKETKVVKKEKRKAYPLSVLEERINKLEEEKLSMIKQQRKDLKGAMAYGGFLFLDLMIVLGVIFFKNNVYKFLVPFNVLNTIFVVIPIIGIFYANKKANEKFQKTFKRLRLPKKEDKEMEEEIKRLGLRKRLLLRWRIYDMKCKLEEYKESCTKTQKIVGRIKGNETKQLIKLKEEIIENILLWKEDFEIKKLNEYGEITNEPVDEEFLSELELDDLYESYFLPGVLSLEKFVNGSSKEEIQKI